MRRPRHDRLLTTLLSLWAAASGAVHAGDRTSQAGILTLRSGDSIGGEFRPSRAAEALHWQAPEFTRPFEFEISSISSVRLPARTPVRQAAGEFALELLDGDLLTGRLLEWTDEVVRLDSAHSGPVSVRTEAIRRIYRRDDNPMLVFSGMSGLSGWKIIAGDWREEGAYVSTSSNEAVLSGDFKLPELAMIEFELSWTRAPNFELTIGVNPESTAEDRRQGWRFEVWDRALVAVREESRSADIAHLEDLSAPGRVHLMAYLNRTSGELHVFHPDGTPAGSLSLKGDVPPAPATVPVTQPPRRRGRSAPEKPTVSTSGPAVRLVNRHGNVRLERLRIIEWSGQLPSTMIEGKTYVSLIGGQTLEGQIVSLDATARVFVLHVDGSDQSIPFEQIATVAITSSTVPTTAESTVLLQDGTRVSGDVQRILADKLEVVSPAIVEPLTVPLSELRSLTVTADGSRHSSGTSEGGRRGVLELGEHRLSGRLASGVETADAQCLVWHPDHSRTSSPLQPDASGRIVYREVKQVSVDEKAETIQVENGQMGIVIGRPQQQEPGFFAKLFLKKAEEPRVVNTGLNPHSLHLRSGDVITCTVIGADETGVTIESPVTEARRVPHDRIKAIELDSRVSPPDLQEAKKQRLLTLPRLQGASPPTHLLCSRTGDFLRCRLLSISPELLRVEVQLEEIEIPSDRVAQIVWFHRDELQTDDTSASTAEDPTIPESRPIDESDDSPDQNEGASESESKLPESEGIPEEDSRFDFDKLVQVLQPEGKRITFDPQEVDGEFISGESDVLGPCRFPLDNIDQLIFGSQIESAAAELAYHQWRLHPAVLPRVAQDLGDGEDDSGKVSPLVGQPAPEIDLDLLGGGRFTLSKEKGTIVVLDFWATWCGPCMQTMPLLEEAAQEFDPDQVRFVSVNLEERAEHVQGVLERHGLAVTVALDIDGVASRRYEASAIPQLVVIDREGTISRLYVGGGPNVIAQLKAMLKEMVAD